MPRPEPQSTPTRSPASAPDGWVRDHADAVFRYARRRVGGALAEEVCQDAFAALFLARAQGRTPDDVGAYLLGTARRRMADVFRTSQRRPPPVRLPEGWEGLSERELPAEALAQAELVELVHVALGLLPGPDRQLLDARYRSGHPLLEIANRLDLTPKAVEMRLARARRAFAACFVRVGRDWIELDSTDTKDDHDEH